MGKPKRFGDIEVEEDFEHEKREWRWQRVGWVLMALLALAALAGLLGPGPVSKTRLAQGGLSVEYERFPRYHAPAEFKVQFDSKQTNEPVHFWIHRDILETMDLKSVHPAPEKVLISPHRHTFVIPQESAGRHQITVEFEPNQFGKASGELGLVSGPKLRIEQFILP